MLENIIVGGYFSLYTFSIALKLIKYVSHLLVLVLSKKLNSYEFT